MDAADRPSQKELKARGNGAVRSWRPTVPEAPHQGVCSPSIHQTCITQPPLSHRPLTLPSPTLTPATPRDPSRANPLVHMQLFERLLESQFTGYFLFAASLGLSAWAVRIRRSDPSAPATAASFPTHTAKKF